MVKEARKIKKIRKKYSPKTINYCFLVGGLSLTIVGLLLMLLSYLSFGDLMFNIATVLSGLGTSVFAGALINHLWYNQVNETTFDLANNALKHAGERVEKIRRNQKIVLQISKNASYITVQTTHSFSYNEKRYGSICISSDFRGSNSEKNPIWQQWNIGDITDQQFIEEINENHPIFYFTKISNSSKDELLLWDDIYTKIQDSNVTFSSDGSCVDQGIKKDLKTLATLMKIDKNKMVYDSKFSVPLGHVANFEFGIHRRYDLKDRLVWSLQEFSSDLEIQIKIDKKDKELSPTSFFFMMNHPLADAIMSYGDNSRYIDENCALRYHDTTIRIDEIILPYQSFEISWRIKD